MERKRQRLSYLPVPFSPDPGRYDSDYFRQVFPPSPTTIVVSDANKSSSNESSVRGWPSAEEIVGILFPPLLGRLFRSEDNNALERNLVFFLFANGLLLSLGPAIVYGGLGVEIPKDTLLALSPAFFGPGMTMIIRALTLAAKYNTPAALEERKKARALEEEEERRRREKRINSFQRSLAAMNSKEIIEEAMGSFLPLAWYPEKIISSRKSIKKQWQAVRSVLVSNPGLLEEIPGKIANEINPLTRAAMAALALDAYEEFALNEVNSGGEGGEVYLDFLTNISKALFTAPKIKDPEKAQAIAMAFTGENPDRFAQLESFIKILAIVDSFMGGLDVLRLFHSQTYLARGINNPWFREKDFHSLMQEVIYSLFPPDNAISNKFLGMLGEISQLSEERNLAPLFSNSFNRERLRNILNQLMTTVSGLGDKAFVLSTLTSAQQLLNYIKISNGQAIPDNLSQLLLENLFDHIALAIDHSNLPPEILKVVMMIGKATLFELQKGGDFNSRPWLFETLKKEVAPPQGFLNKLKEMPSDKFWKNDGISDFLSCLLLILWENFDRLFNQWDRKYIGKIYNGYRRYIPDIFANIIEVQKSITEVVIDKVQELITAKRKNGQSTLLIEDETIRDRLKRILESYPKEEEDEKGDKEGETNIIIEIDRAGHRSVSVVVKNYKQNIEYAEQDIEYAEQEIEESFNFFRDFNEYPWFIERETLVLSIALNLISDLYSRLISIENMKRMGESIVDKAKSGKTLLEGLRGSQKKLPSSFEFDAVIKDTEQNLESLKKDADDLNFLITNVVFPFFKNLFTGSYFTLSGVAISDGNLYITITI